ncbi:SusE domain-containing protein [Chryseobacterium oranimense]|uniref:SusE domain-containing protein n=1 Tax=Chryseobacterium oranimense TaxID=421058 RepID=UPI0031E2290E
MKNLFKIFTLLVLGFLVISCEKDEDKVVLGNPSASTLTSDKSSLVLTKDNEAQNAVTFNWKAPDYGVAVAQKNQLQIAIKGTNFASPKNVDLNDGDIKATYTVAEFNSYALDAGLAPNVATDIEVRLSSKLGNYEAINSNVVTIKVTPYMTAYPSFYIVGEASAVGWNANVAQMLYKKDNFSTIYTYLENGKAFRFLGQQDWGPANYSLDVTGMNNGNKYFKTWSTNLAPSTPENIQFNGATGMYKIVIDADATVKSITVSASPINNWNPANLYIVGTVNGWNAGTAIPMTNLGNGKFEYTTTLPAASEFKFLGQQSWGDLDWGNITTDGNTGFIGPKGSNGNIKFDGTGGSYKISVDLKLGTYKIQPL